MYFEGDDEPFNPFSVGPSVGNTRFTYMQPKGTTYPPPVFATRPTRTSSTNVGYDTPVTPSFPPPVYATWPPPKPHHNRSVSQGSLVKGEADDGISIKSQKGSIGYSKAINEEMAAAKNLKTDAERILAGGKSKSSVAESASGDKTLTTLMAVRKPRSTSKSSGTTISNHTPSETASRKRAQYQLGINKSEGSQAAVEMDKRSTASKRTDSNITLKQLKALPNITKSSHSNASNSVSRTSKREDAGAHELDRNSHASVASQADRVSIRSKASTIAQQADNVSRVSLKTKASVQHADNVSKASIKSKASVPQADNISHVSIKSKASIQRADSISRNSIQSKASVQRADSVSRSSIQSKASARQADNISHVSVRSKASVQPQDDKKSRVSLKVQTGDNISQVEAGNTGYMHSNVNGKMTSPQELAQMVRNELKESMETSKSLGEKAALISDRLRAGNEFKHNRFHSLIRMYTNTEPLKRCREDRMSFWFNDAVLS